MSETPNRRHVTKTEIVDFYTAPEDKARVRDEYLQAQCETNDLEPYLWKFFLPDGKKQEYPFLCASWLGLTHGITEEGIYPTMQDVDDTGDEFLMVTMTADARIEITRQDMEQAQSGEEFEFHQDSMRYFIDARRRNITLFALAPEAIH